MVQCTLPPAVTKGTAITAGGKIYLIGGQNQSGDKLNQVLEYNPDLNSWSQKANMQYARHGLRPFISMVVYGQ